MSRMTILFFMFAITKCDIRPQVKYTVSWAITDGHFKLVQWFVWVCMSEQCLGMYLAELITVKENSCSIQLRSDGCLQEKKTNNKFGDRAFSICGPVLWNRLPKCMKEINSLDKFKKELKTHLFKEAFG